MKKLAFLALVSLVSAACDGSDLDGDGSRVDAPTTPPSAPSAPSAPSEATAEQVDAFNKLESATRQRWSWSQDARHSAGAVSMHLTASRTVQGSVNDKALVVNAGSDPVYATLSLLAAHKGLFKMKSPATELAISKAEVDRLGMTHTRFQQNVRGVPVVGAELMAHYDAVGHLTSIDSNYVPDLDLDVTPKVASGEALSIVKAEILAKYTASESTLESDDGKLVVYSSEGAPAKLAYQYKVRVMEAKEPAIWVTTVDATTGEILHRYNNLQTIQGQGVGFLGDTKTFEVTANGGGGFVMTDTSNGVQIRTLTARQASTAPGSQITSTISTSWDTGVAGAGAAVDAHVNAIAVFKYYKEKHARNAIDGAGGAMLSTAHYGQNFQNAAWDSIGMFYGDGGAILRPLSVSLDVVGHEFTHGVIEKTSNLIYENQPGALNEAIADIMGAFVEHSVKPDEVNNWKLGEAAMRQGTALRDMKNPAAVDDPQPGHMTKFVNTQQDNGGVHINSGIINNAAFLMTVGGTNPVSNVAVKYGIGWEKSEKLWYRANTQYFMQSTNFGAAAQGLLSAAKDIGLTQNETNIVDCAFKATGVTRGTCATLVDPTSTTPATTSGTPDNTASDSPSDSANSANSKDEEANPTPKRRRMVTQEVSACNAAPGHSSFTGGALIALAFGLVAARRRKK
jgi:bacillolysin